MSAKVTIDVTQGPMQGKTFLFEEHDTFIFGRMPDCHARLPDDPKVSRNHFMLEVNPPDARVRDLGSLNGTHVNGKKHGGRQKDETPEQGAKRQYPEVDLKDGDRIEVGDTLLMVSITADAVCAQCNGPIGETERAKCAWIGGTFLCAACKQKMAASAQPPAKPEPPRCQKCGKDVSTEIGAGRRGNYICQACRPKAEADPMDLVRQMIRQAVQERGGEATPKIDGYDIEKLLGKGGMGVVYLARTKKDGQRVALKVMLSKVAVNEQSRKAFLREMEVARGLRHPNIVQFIDQGSVGTAFYFIMELCDGGNVDELMKAHRGRLPLAVAKPIMLQTLVGLAFAHEKNLVHRDLKPMNVLLCSSPSGIVAKLSDFGLSKNFQKAGFSGMTVTGSTAGTPVFMPREQLVNFRYVKPPSDVWSIAATFYNMLTGQFPRDFQAGKDPMEIVLNGKIVPIRKRDASINKKLAEVIDRALDNDAKARYQTAAEMHTALTAVL